jgi:hypothetical protein
LVVVLAYDLNCWCAQDGVRRVIAMRITTQIGDIPQCSAESCAQRSATERLSLRNFGGDG